MSNDSMSEVISRVILAKHALPRSQGELPEPMAKALEQLPNGFGQQSLGGPEVALDLKKLTKPTGAWRLRVGGWRAVFFPGEGEFLVAAVGRRRDVYERLSRLRLARKADGLKVMESQAPETEVGDAPQRVVKRLRPRTLEPADHNGFSAYSDDMLRQIDGINEDSLTLLRSLPANIDVTAELPDRITDIDLAFLLADLWERPEIHLGSFDEGKVPTAADIEISEEEIAARLESPDSATSLVAAKSKLQIQRLLDGTIEDWMIYLHPSQRSIANATFNGPSRVRGGPGTGKTVVALHRARVLSRKRVEPTETVLLTTFLKTLPDVWESLMGRLDDAANRRLEIRNVDSLAWKIVATENGKPDICNDDQRKKYVSPLLQRHGLVERFGDDPKPLLDEFDTFLAGRDITELDDYLTLRRHGSGSRLSRTDRERVFAAYSEYRQKLKKERVTDYAHLRLEALRLAKEGAGPRFNGVIVDEAQDLTAAGVRLLLQLDSSEEHRHFMVVGDGQQSIYPGGFSMREVGIDIVGRSHVLNTNWRNTWSVWATAQQLIADQMFDDLDDEAGLRPTGDEPEPLAVGEATQLHIVGSHRDELDLLALLVRDRLEAGVDPGDIAVLVDVNKRVRDSIAALERSGLKAINLAEYDGQHAEGVLVGTFHRAKGLEFKEVLIPGMGAGDWPNSWFVSPKMDDEERTEAMALQLRALFVAATRARERLTLLSTGQPNDQVRRAQWTMDVGEY